MVPITQEQQVALDIIRTSNSIATAEQLAALIVNPTVPKYGQLPEGARRRWLGQQIIGLNYIAHSSRAMTEVDLTIETTMLDQIIMDNGSLRSLTQVEMQEAFRRGIAKEYGDYYGITASSIAGFLNGFLRGEKRQKAKAILYEREQKELREGDARFWKELSEAKERGVEIPLFNHGPFEDDEQHKKRIEQQRRAINNVYRND